MKVKLNGIANEELFTPGAEYVVQEFFTEEGYLCPAANILNDKGEESFVLIGKLEDATCAFLKEGYWELIE